jgi:hypothetical protein
MMGSYKISQTALTALSNTVDVVRIDFGLGTVGNFRVHIAAVDGCLEVIRSEQGEQD